MIHDYRDIPAQVPRVQEILQRRQELSAELGSAALVLAEATARYNDAICAMIQNNEDLQHAELNPYESDFTPAVAS